jgi:hypothetical protein
MNPDALREIAALFASQRAAAWDATPRYDMLSDSLVWTNELPEPDGRNVSPIRPVIRHRTCLILGIPPEFPEWWTTAQSLFPTWIGFSPARSIGNSSLVDIYQYGLTRALESMERHFE